MAGKGGHQVARRQSWLYGLVLLLGLLTVYPLSTLVYGSLIRRRRMPSESDLDGYAKVFTLDNLDILGDSIAIAFTKSAIAVALAVLSPGSLHARTRLFAARLRS